MTKSTLLLAALLAFAVAPLAVPSASACIGSCGPLVQMCVAGVTADSCWPGGDVCFYSGYEVPFCIDVPCYHPIDCIATGSAAPRLLP